MTHADRVATAMVALLTAGALAVPGLAQEAAPPPCSDDPALAALDFWLGEWTVWSGGEEAGANAIRKVQGGCALEERWRSSSGGTGQSLFYYLPVPGEWRQVWVTPYALVPGGVKEKRQVEAPEGSVRFQGAIEQRDGPPYLDRTTLTPLPEGEVRQLIEVSTDGGASWRATFDAVYRPAGGRR